MEAMITLNQDSDRKYVIEMDHEVGRTRGKYRVVSSKEKGEIK